MGWRFPHQSGGSKYEPEDFSYFRWEKNYCSWHAACFTKKKYWDKSWEAAVSQQKKNSFVNSLIFPRFYPIIHLIRWEQPLLSHTSFTAAEERQNLKLHIPIFQVQSPLGQKLLCLNENTSDPLQLCTKQPQHGTSLQLSTYIRAWVSLHHRINENAEAKE